MEGKFSNGKMSTPIIEATKYRTKLSEGQNIESKTSNGRNAERQNMGSKIEKWQNIERQNFELPKNPMQNIEVPRYRTQRSIEVARHRKQVIE